MKTTKTLYICLLCALLPLAGHGGLVSTINTDTVSDFDVDWSWDPEIASTDTPALGNWYVFISTVTNAGNWLVRIELQHKAIPHATESVPPVTYKNYAFSIATDFGVVINDSFDILHPGEGHLDSYAIVLDRSPTPSATTWTIQGTHQIPEPSSMVLVGLTGGLIGFIRRRII